MKENPGAIISPLIRPGPSEITVKNLNFLITDRPTDANLPSFLEELKKRNVKEVVRVCEPTYNTETLRQQGIGVTDLQFDDGTPPPQEIVDAWFALLRERFKQDPTARIAVHCVAGLGRAPVMVALALIELGLKYEDAVELIRQKRRGAINAKQLAYLSSYKPKNRLNLKSGQGKCLIQ